MALGLGIGLSKVNKGSSFNPVAEPPVNVIRPVISPSGNQVIGTLFTAGNGSWFGTRPFTFEYQWTRDGIAIGGETNRTYTSVSADEGKTLRCEVRASNAFGISPFVSSSNSATGVSLPVNTVAPVISGSTTLGSVLTTTDGTWTGTSPITFSYQWKRGGVSIGGATASTYTLVTADSSANIICEVTGTNAAGSVAAGSNTITAQNFNLVNTVAPVISGSTTFGSVLTTTNGTWTGASPITYGYQWKRNGSIISAATSSTYTLVAADSLANITCDVTATNPLGSVAANSNTITAQNFNPINTIAPTLSPSGTQSTGTVITLGNGTWSGATPITFEYRWTRNNIVISGQTSNTYTIVAGDDGTVIKGEVRGTNALSTSAYVTSSNQVDAVAFDPDAVAFFSRVTTAGGTLSGTERTATNQLVLDMKSAGVWTSMKAIYPMVGASAAACAQNLKSSSFTGSFFGGWIFASTGVKPNGVNGYMKTDCFANQFTENSQHLSNYSRQLTNTGNVEIGLVSYDTSKFNYVMFQHNTSLVYAAVQSTDIIMDSLNDPGYGLAISNRRNSTLIQRYLRNVKTEVSGAGNGLGTQEIFMSSIQGTFLFSTCEIAFASLGDGLTDTNASDLFTAVQAFQTTLSRQV